MPSVDPPVADTSPDDVKDAAAEASLLRKGSALLRTWRAIFDGLVALAVLEARLVGLSAAAILGLGLAAGVLFITAWLLLMAGFALWLVYLGAGWGLALLCIALINALTGGGLVVLIIKLSRNLLFQATRRQMTAIIREKQHAGTEEIHP